MFTSCQTPWGHAPPLSRTHTSCPSVAPSAQALNPPLAGHLPTPLGPARPTRCLGSKNERKPMPACPHFLSWCAQDPDQTLISKGQPQSFHTQILHSAASLTCGNFRNSNHRRQRLEHRETDSPTQPLADPRPQTLCPQLHSWAVDPERGAREGGPEGHSRWAGG